MPDHAILETAAPLFRILQVTDLHTDIEERLNERTREDIRAMLARSQPDLIAVTGDVWCGEERPETAPMWRQRDLAFFGSLGAPWVLTFGNHDCVEDMERVLGLIAATPHAVAPVGDGRGSFRIELRQAGTNPAQACWDLFFINSGARWRLPEDLAWFEQETRRINTARGRVLPGVAFFHIALKNYQDAIDEGRTIGIGSEDVLGWGNDDGSAAPMLKQPGNLRACFCGHSHENDFHFIEDGVLFGYGRATGHGGYGGDKLAKGATLIELEMRTGRLSFKTIFADGSEWSH